MDISFEIFRDGLRLESYQPVAAMVLSAESVPVAGEIANRAGRLRIGSPDQALGLSLLWDCGPLGRFQLETTRLPPRAEPYNLNVEIARCRIMKLWHKLEDWDLLDPSTGPWSGKVAELQTRFAEVLVAAREPGTAAVLADALLQDAIGLSEELTQAFASSQLQRRANLNAFGRHVVGCRIDWSLRSQRLKDLAADAVDFAVLPIIWRRIQPKEGVFDTAALDEWVEYLTRRRVPLIAGPVVDLSESALPDWAFIWEHDFETLRDLMVDFLRKVVLRYRRAFSVWNVAVGLHSSSVAGLGQEQVIDLTRLLLAQVKSMIPTARTLVTIRDPFGDERANSNHGMAPAFYAETIAQAGANFDAFGIELSVGAPRPGGWTRDLFQFSAMLDRVGAAGKPVCLTAVAAPGRTTPDPSDASEGTIDPNQSGAFAQPWSPQAQAQWLDALARVALSKPFVESITWADLSDVNASVPGGGLLDDMLRSKPVLETLQSVRRNYQRRDKKP
jgi:hypothetical protein